MDISVRFLGAARNVTGSRYLLSTGGRRLLVDCGMFQERAFRGRNWADSPVPAESVDAVLLTHAHLDHCGLLPKFVAEGFKGPIYCTKATEAIARIVLLDSAHIQEEDAEFKKKRHQREGRRGPHPEVPLYTADDVQAVFPRFRPLPYQEPVEIAEGIHATFNDGGHILGSSMIKVEVENKGEGRSVLFSGDVGRWSKPILRDPDPFDEADYVLIESTYGTRLHESPEAIDQRLENILNSTEQAGGNIVIPSFAIERTQELLYHLNHLLIEQRVPEIAIFVDSPMAIKVNEVFEKHADLFDKEMLELVNRSLSPFDLPNLNLSRTTRESKAINRIRGTVIIIAGSGMCTGGRIKHHLKHNIERPESTLLFIGYQAQGTLGRQIVSGGSPVRIHGRQWEVKARVEQINGFSAHADRDELLRWISFLKRPPEQVLVTHGEEETALSFAGFLQEQTGWKTYVPEYGEEVRLY